MASVTVSYLIDTKGKLNYLAKSLSNNYYAKSLSKNSHLTKASREKYATYFDLSKEIDPSEIDKAKKLSENPEAVDPEGDPELEKQILPLVTNEEVSPLLAESFEGVPPTYIVTCGMDALRDDGIVFAKRLKESGKVSIVEHRHYKESAHSDFSFVPEPFVRDLNGFLEKNQIW